MADSNHYDLIVIGSGPGGYVGAIRAAQLGMKVACVERDRLGGVCLNWGCIPTKALLHNAELYREAIIHGQEWGFEVDPAKVKVNWERVIGRSRGITDKITSGVGFLFKKNKVTHVQGHARIVSGKSAHGPCKVEVTEPVGDYYHGSGDTKKVKATLTADRVMVATGAAPKELPFAKVDGRTIISSYDAMNLARKPESMIIVGSGAIGMEFAYFYNAFGTKVTVVEMVDRILPVEDDDISKLAQRVFSKQGITFFTGHTVKAVDKKKSGVSATIVDVNDEKNSQKIDCEILLLAIGIGARVDGLFDDKLGLKIEKGHIKTDYRDPAPGGEPTYRTSVPGVHAVGDVIGPPWLAHKAMEEAVTCVERMAGHHTIGIDYNAIPGATYCNPQIASIGMTERDAKAKGVKYKVGKYSFQAHGKAIAVGATEGMVKMITSEPYGEILGAHIIGEDASELIAEISLAMRLEATAEDIISTIHAHPTMHEGVHEAALGTEGRMIHA
ncbi:MAG: dihydrolipoyl dehydrogenase [Phycisphaerales bacterium]|nr:dihydrolipoyl dehydrogenase [Phycisphaerales bacterium]MCI0631912.1 dihydrolipoyl dehydrogenase [Phycisphaerales bacterium]MCI0676442.1 dihydrolipoyl dehydrogenase [Phycisphaerales bacterium]